LPDESKRKDPLRVIGESAAARANEEARDKKVEKSMVEEQAKEVD
jgi:hypothetical protein